MCYRLAKWTLQSAGHATQSGSVGRPRQNKLMQAQGSARKACFTVHQVVYPHSIEQFVKTQVRKLLPVFHKLVPPHSQGLRVVRTVVLHAINVETGAVTHSICQCRYAWATTTWKDVRRDKIARTSIYIISVVGHGDDLQGNDAFRPQVPITSAEKISKKLVTNCLQHFDRYDPVKRPLHFTIVTQQQIYAVGDACSIDSLLSKIQLLLRKGDTSNCAPVLLDRHYGELAPSEPDLENVAARF
mmetsp:Transcript_6003/g.18076  ORF Transcript_6003/g.18076 Transcript_6003/m.18076 type:complete len:243 (+) Transcript_6003:646-1374(+)